jgi:hypothetical protein
MIFTLSVLSGFHSIEGSVALQLTLFVVNACFVRPSNVVITGDTENDEKIYNY